MTNAFTALAPRQSITPVPYALFAPTAATANNVVANAISAPQLNTPGAPAGGQVLAYSGTSLVWTNPSSAATGWALNGNTGTAPGVNFLGTTDNQPLELKANGQRILRLEPNALGPNVIAGDASNYVSSGVSGATIAGGGGDSNGNVVMANRSAIGGGNANSIREGAIFSVIGGGAGNRIDTNALLASICGGRLNTVFAEGATLVGGANNTISGRYATLGGGMNNAIQSGAYQSVIAWGIANIIQTDAYQSTISGGYQNQIRSGASSSVISGGVGNTIRTNVIGAVVPGGIANTAGGRGSFAAGSGANALHDGTFVWSDLLGTVPPNFASSVSNEFAVRATGGVRFVSAVDIHGGTIAGVTLPAGSGSWTTLSDRGSKTNFLTVSARELLDRLIELPIQSWNYKSQGDAVRHIGPTAQDFHAAFKLGEDDRHIATVDEGGVALAAIQGLAEIVRQQQSALKVQVSALDELKTQNAELRRRLSDLESAVNRLTNQSVGGAR